MLSSFSNCLFVAFSGVLAPLMRLSAGKQSVCVRARGQWGKREGAGQRVAKDGEDLHVDSPLTTPRLRTLRAGFTRLEDTPVGLPRSGVGEHAERPPREHLLDRLLARRSISLLLRWRGGATAEWEERGWAGGEGEVGGRGEGSSGVKHLPPR